MFEGGDLDAPRAVWASWDRWFKHRRKGESTPRPLWMESGRKWERSLGWPDRLWEPGQGFDEFTGETVESGPRLLILLREGVYVWG